MQFFYHFTSLHFPLHFHFPLSTSLPLPLHFISGQLRLEGWVHEYYDKWLLHKKPHPPPAPVLVIDADQALEEVKKEYELQKPVIMAVFKIQNSGSGSRPRGYDPNGGVVSTRTDVLVHQKNTYTNVLYFFLLRTSKT
ncbi:hypothetical protein GWK47_052545 [Chionoecetes opilio]|uniref:Uncharacterized protein n=1 Tax=Chionoecetes opilio TaxID=41210 RepID=A0A8J5CQ18_CHIOP|nr:hypothetical protein GWK47_052545 [Chionoecetes opilio]